MVTDDDALDAAAAACGPAAAVQPQVEGPPPLMMARQAASGLDPAQEQHDRMHSGELTSTSVGIFELIDKSVRDVLHQQQAPVCSVCVLSSRMLYSLGSPVSVPLMTAHLLRY